MKSWSLKLRLSLLIYLILLFIIITISIVAYVELRESLLRNIDPTLKAMAEGILSGLDENVSRETHQAIFRSITGHTGQRYSNWYRIWMDGTDKELFASDLPDGRQDQLLANLSPDIRPEVGEFLFFNLTLKGYTYRALLVRHPFEQGVANIIVASSSRYVYHEMEEFLRLLFVLGGSLAAASLLLVFIVVGWAMRPVGKIAAVLREVTPKNIEQETLYGLKVPKELLPFAAALGEMLIRLNKAAKQQKQFIADASHELRTPLAVIKSTVQTTRLADRDITDYTKALDDILHDVNRIEQLVEHLLSLARIDESVNLLNAARIDLCAMLVYLAEIFNAKASQQGGKVICDKCLPSQVSGNESELNQLFTNILDNAVKYGPPNGIIRITITHETDGFATVCIHDDGGEIPPKSLPRLFERFYRVESSRSRAMGGAGLGLSIAKEIANHHGGDIEITSDIRSGTSVFVKLPRL